MVFESVFGNFLANINNFVDEKYILSDNAFVLSENWNLKTTIKFPVSRIKGLDYSNPFIRLTYSLSISSKEQSYLERFSIKPDRYSIKEKTF